MPTTEQLLKRLRKKSKKGMRGWPVATIAFYGPDANRATKVAVGIIRHESAEPELREWQLLHGDVRNDEAIAAEMLWHMEQHGVKSVAMTDGVMGCPHQEGIDYEGEYCPDPECAFWHGRDRFTHKLVQ